MRRQDREVTGTENILKILCNAQTMSVAMVDDGMPYVVNVSYGVVADGKNISLCFHTAKAGRKMDIIVKNPNVAVSIVSHYEVSTADNACKWTAKYTSVYAEGKAVVVEDNVLKKLCFDKIMERSGAAGEQVYTPASFENTAIVKIELAHVTAKSAE